MVCTAARPARMDSFLVKNEKMEKCLMKMRINLEKREGKMVAKLNTTRVLYHARCDPSRCMRCESQPFSLDRNQTPMATNSELPQLRPITPTMTIGRSARVRRARNSQGQPRIEAVSI